MQYVFAQNPGVLALGQMDQFLPSPLQGLIGMDHPNPGSRAISAHKLNLGFTEDANEKVFISKLYSLSDPRLLDSDSHPHL